MWWEYGVLGVVSVPLDHLFDFYLSVGHGYSGLEGENLCFCHLLAGHYLKMAQYEVDRATPNGYKDLSGHLSAVC